jgi:hypothetical protein
VEKVDGRSVVRTAGRPTPDATLAESE